MLMLGTAGACTSDRASSSQPSSPALLRELFDAATSRTPAVASDMADRIAAASADSSWPMLMYLAGEAHLRRGNTAAAKTAFARLTSWAATNHPAGPYGDTWGGSGLAAVGLWRWLQILLQQPSLDSAEVDAVVVLASQLRETRLYGGMVRPGLLPALPTLEESIADRLAHLAWKQQHPEAVSLFVDFLTLHSSDTLDGVDQELYAEMLKRGLATTERLDLFRSRRMLGLAWPRAQKGRAAGILRRLWDDRQVPSDVRAEAGYEWANYRRLQPNRAELLEILTEVIGLAADQPLAERALYARAIVHSRGGGAQDTEAFRGDLAELLRRFPKGRLADDALNQFAGGYFYARDPDNTVAYYRRLQNFDGPNDFLDSAYYFPALALIARNGEGDLDEADRILETYSARYPNGVFRGRALFWRGRIAERKGGADTAITFFRQVIADVPYDYYGLRARMHLEDGAAAIGVGIPAPDSQVRSDLRERYGASRADPELTGQSPYHERLRAVGAGALYQKLIQIGERNRARLDDIPLDELDAAGLIPATAMLLAIRLDALAARDVDPAADNWLRLAGFLGRSVGDWSLAIEMTVPQATDAPERLTALQNDPRYLASAYPDAAALGSLPQWLAASAWPIEDAGSLSQSLMYAVIRQESRFYPGAISQAGALGLFQFMPQTFRGLNGDRLLRSSGMASEVDFLLDPARNVALWAGWMQGELKFVRRDDLAPVLMKHQAGSGNVSRWADFWRALGAETDLEYRIETARFAETRNFVRWTLRDMAMVDASGMFENRVERKP